jgi:hypothetical protein
VYRIKKLKAQQRAVESMMMIMTIIMMMMMMMMMIIIIIIIINNNSLLVAENVPYTVSKLPYRIEVTLIANKRVNIYIYIREHVCQTPVSIYVATHSTR